VKLVVDWERRNRGTHVSDKAARLEDHVWRAWALLTHARRMASSEALQHLSALRLGVCLGLLDHVDLATIQALMVTMRPGHLQLGFSRELGPDERDVVRAQAIRDTLVAK
jgi:protein arginine kinase